jgi:hypothetical protein
MFEVFRYGVCASASPILRRCISKNQNVGTLWPHPSFYLLRTLDMDRGWSMTLSSAFFVSLFALAIAGLAHANNQQTQQSCVNTAICLLAVRSGLSPGRRSDLQAHHTVSGDRRSLIRSNTIDQSISQGRKL